MVPFRSPVQCSIWRTTTVVLELMSRSLGTVVVPALHLWHHADDHVHLPNGAVVWVGQGSVHPHDGIAHLGAATHDLTRPIPRPTFSGACYLRLLLRAHPHRAPRPLFLSCVSARGPPSLSSWA